ncbi:MAG: Ig-like domain-containing protein, partial [Nakamurella sp.]
GSVPGGADTIVGTPITDGTATSGVVDGLALGVGYQLQVAATNLLGMSAFSALSNVITPRLLPVISLRGSGVFPRTVVGVTSAPLAFTLSNTGLGELTISDITLNSIGAGTGAASFALDRTSCGATLAAGSSCELRATFTPVGVGFRIAAVIVVGEGAASQQLIVSGTSLAVPSPAASLTGSGNFGNTVIGTSGAAQLLTLANTGGGPLSVSSVALTGADAGAFTLDRSGCGAAVAANSSCTMAVTFAPTTVGAKTATVTVADNAVGSPRSVTLSGTALPVPPAPTVTARTPAANATGVNSAADLTATFSVPVTGVSGTTFTLRQGTTAVPAVVSQVGTTPQWTLNPAANLAASTVYTVTLTGGPSAVRSTDGVALSAVTWTFTTAAPADTTAPTVTGRTPASAATAVAVARSVTATFSEPLNAATAVAANATLRQGTTTTGALIAVAVTYNATTRTLTVDPTSNLASDTRYTVRLTNGVRDVAGNALVATSWSFLTGPAPTVVTLNPANNATAVPVGNNVTGTFSEAVAGVTTSTVTLRAGTAATGTLVPAGVTYNATSRVMTLNPNANLSPDTRYTIRLSTGITDVAGNPLVAASSTFLTGPAPSITTRTPGVNATAVGRTANVTATFSEAVVGARVTGTSVTLRSATAGTLIAALVTYNSTTRVVTLNPNATLAASTRYTVRLDATITDAAGNPLPVTSWTFTTGA